MIGLRRLLAMLALCAAVASMISAGCSKFNPGEPNENLRPETVLSFAPEQGDTANYRIRLNWFGWDPDGEVAYFWTQWDDFDSVRVVSTDSIFRISAADTFDSQRGYAYHTFWVAAVDNQGLADLSKARLAFTAYTIAPDTQFERGGSPPTVTGPMVTFEWVGSDVDGVITGYGYALYEIAGGETTLLEWEDDLPASVTTYELGPVEGKHMFDVWSTDDAGAKDQSPARSVFTCNPDLAGPKITVKSNAFGRFSFRTKFWDEGWVGKDPIPIFAGERLSFTWSAESEFGGQILGYLHAYDDTTTWPAWSIFDNTFEVVPEIGTHRLFISAIDNANSPTKGMIWFRVVPAHLDQNILIVDDWNNWETSPNYGTDAMRDAFYDSLIVGRFAHRAAYWDTWEHSQGAQPRPPTVSVLANASTVIWYSDHDVTALEAVFDPYVTTYNSLAGYLRVGGNLILAGEENLRQISGQGYPFVVSASDTTPSIRFIREHLHIGRGDFSGRAPNPPWNFGYCLHCALPTGAIDLEPMCIDTLGKWFYPYNGTGVAWQDKKGCGVAVESMEYYQGTALEIMKVHAFKNRVFPGRTCATLYLSGDNHANTAYFGFPLYYMKTKDVIPVLDKILTLFGEEKLGP